MKDMQVVRANEKLRRSSTIVGNGGLALLIGGLSRWYGTGLDLTAAIWLFASAALTWMGVQVNELIEAEDT